MTTAKYEVRIPRTDDELRTAFATLKRRSDVARLLGISDRELIYLLYRGGMRYITFTIPKRAGGVRQISAPDASIKILQKRLNQVLQAVYAPKAPVQGFARDRSIVTNADRHTRKRVVLNLDLEDFFPTIHFGRVRGVFASPPYALPLGVAQVLAQICTLSGSLPQGAPTSPIISNMVCAGLDSGLRRLAEDHGCTYTRYADDITFSTTRRRLPEVLLSIQDVPDGRPVVTVGTALRQVVEANTFRINEHKVRVRAIGQRTEVTGLIVHRGVNVPREFIRSVRGLLHAWERYGYDSAEAELRTRHYRKHSRPGTPPANLLAVAAGKIEFIRMVRGANDLLYTKLWNRFVRLAGGGRQPRVALAEDVDQVPRALWILESTNPNDSSEVWTGTAFVLDGFGLVTCAHCLGDNPFIYQPDSVLTTLPVTVSHRCPDRDLAFLKTDQLLLSGLRLGVDGGVKQGDSAIVAGFGNYAKGGTSRLTQGHITARGPRHGIDVLFSDHRVFDGNSGGPVLTAEMRVIGVLQRAGSPKSPSQETTILPISLLKDLPTVSS